MDDPRIGIWNILHDGEITVASSTDDVVQMFICIPYLRRRFRPLGDSFVLSLLGVTQCEFRHFDGEVTTLEEALEVGAPEIFSTGSHELPVTVATTLGELVLSFREVKYTLDTGEAVAVADIAATAEAYWSEFAARGQTSNRA